MLLQFAFFSPTQEILLHHHHHDAQRIANNVYDEHFTGSQKTYEYM